MTDESIPPTPAQFGYGVGIDKNLFCASGLSKVRNKEQPYLDIISFKIDSMLCIQTPLGNQLAHFLCSLV